MGYMTAFGQCVVCGNMFSFNPDKVPSVRVKGEREPICKECVIGANKIRVHKGLDPIPISKDSYSPEEVY